MRPLSPVSALAPARPVSRRAFVDAMACAANGVNVVATDGAAGRFGVTVSAATSVTAEPPSLLVCIHDESPATAAIEHNGVFCLNVLEASQRALSEVFAGRVELDDKFSTASWSTLLTGAPALEGAAAVFDCRVDAVHVVGTHHVIIGLVVAARAGVGEPLVYSHRAYARPLWDRSAG